MINEDLPNPINQTLFQLSIFRFEISESFFCNSLAAQCTTASRQWALPIRGQTAELGLSLGPASAPAGPAKVCPCFCTTCKRLPRQDSGFNPCLPCKSLGSAHAGPAKVCPCLCRPISAPAFRPCKILGSASVGPAIV